MLSHTMPRSEEMEWETALHSLDELLLAFVVSWYMNSLWISCSEHLLAEVAGDWYSLQMLCLDVGFHVTILFLFPANIANIDRPSMYILSWTFCHQRVDLFVKVLNVARVFICYGYCSSLRISWFASRICHWCRLCHSCFVFEECIISNRNFWGLSWFLLFSLV